jgi:hypothetical protein
MEIFLDYGRPLKAREEKIQRYKKIHLALNTFVFLSSVSIIVLFLFRPWFNLGVRVVFFYNRFEISGLSLISVIEGVNVLKVITLVVFPAAAIVCIVVCVVISRKAKGVIVCAFLTLICALLTLIAFCVFFIWFENSVEDRLTMSIDRFRYIIYLEYTEFLIITRIVSVLKPVAAIVLNILTRPLAS